MNPKDTHRQRLGLQGCWVEERKAAVGDAAEDQDQWRMWDRTEDKAYDPGDWQPPA